MCLTWSFPAEDKFLAQVIQVLESCRAMDLRDWGQGRGAVAVDALPPDAGTEQRQGIASPQGCLLLEAPTGSGKTLIAAHLIEAFSEKERVVWFWYAPFKGVRGTWAWENAAGW